MRRKTVPTMDALPKENANLYSNNLRERSITQPIVQKQQMLDRIDREFSEVTKLLTSPYINLNETQQKKFRNFFLNLPPEKRQIVLAAQSFESLDYFIKNMSEQHTDKRIIATMKAFQTNRAESVYLHFASRYEGIADGLNKGLAHEANL